jgi:hypothetical protein
VSGKTKVVDLEDRMLVELGNVAPLLAENDGHPRVTTMVVPDSYTYEVADSSDQLATDSLMHIARSSGGVTHMPDQEALLSVVGAWQLESGARPTWVWSDNENFAVLLGKYFDCPVGRPDNLEQTHHTMMGAPGSAGRDAEADAAVSTANEPSEA